ncbi:MAG: hypothetical protein QOF80_11 [Verrucomicrobiota bacterium]
MKKPGRLLAVICLAGLLVCPGADGSGFPKPPKSAATREELFRHFGTTIGFGQVAKWDFTSGGRELIIFSYSPYSGRAVCYVHAYYRSRAQQAWVLFIDRVIEPAIKLSAEISSDDHLLVLKDMEGKVVEKQSIRSLPR